MKALQSAWLCTSWSLIPAGDGDGDGMASKVTAEPALAGHRITPISPSGEHWRAQVERSRPPPAPKEVIPVRGGLIDAPDVLGCGLPLSRWRSYARIWPHSRSSRGLREARHRARVHRIRPRRGREKAAAALAEREPMQIGDRVLPGALSGRDGCERIRLESYASGEEPGVCCSNKRAQSVGQGAAARVVQCWSHVIVAEPMI